MDLRKAIVVTTSLSRAGGGVYDAVRRLSQAMARHTAVEVHGIRDHCTAGDMEHWLPLSPVAYKGIGPLRFSSKMAPTIAGSAANGTVLHLHGLWTWPSYASLRISDRYGIPRIISPHGMLDPWALKNSGWKKWIVRKWFEDRNLGGAHCLHALCESEYESIRSFGLENPVAIIPNGIDFPDFERSRFNVQGSTKKSRKLLSLGRIHPKKGLKELIEAWAQVRRTEDRGQGAGSGGVRSEWQLLIAGWDDGGHLDGLQKQATELGLHWRDLSQQPVSPGTPISDFRSPILDLCFLGPRFGEEKDSLLRSVDAFILPSFSEGLPMSVLEAWAYALPVVMTDFCNIPAGFETDSAVRIEPNPDSIAEGIRTLVSMPDGERLRIGQNGLNLVREQFTWEKVAEQMLQVYRWLLGRGGRPECVRT